MKTTLHYIIAILLFSLHATHAFAEGEKGPFNITNERGGITHSYNAEKALLSIGGTGSITITGDGTPVQARIEIKNQSIVNLTIQDLHIQAEVPLTVNNHSGADASAVTNIILKGTNILESNAADSRPGMLINWSTSISGSGSLTVKGSSRGGAGIGFGEFYKISTPMIIQDNIVVVAIGGIDASGIGQTERPIQHEGGLLIQGKVDGNATIEHTSSALAGDLTLGTDFEIPSWATVTIPDGQSITVPEGITLTNEGTLKTEEGTLTNNGSIINEGTLETKDGSLVNEGVFTNNGITTSNKFLNIGGEDGFDVSTNGNGAAFKYDGANKLLTIRSGSGTENVLLKGKNKDKAVDCGIVIEGSTVTIEDLNIKAGNAMVFKKSGGRTDFSLTLKGTNRLESTTGPGIKSEISNVSIYGTGSLTVIGEAKAFGALILFIEDNACIVAISQDGTSNIIQSSADNLGLFISGTKKADNITHEYSQLMGNMTLGTDFEIPEWATVAIPKGQTITVPEGITLTNKGTLETEEGGTLTNQGSIINEGTLKTENGTLVNKGTIETNGIKTSSKFLNIGGDDGFNVSTQSDGVIFSYEANTQLLTIYGVGNVLLKGIGEKKAVECGIVIAKEMSIGLTIEDLNIRADNALVFEGQNSLIDYYPILQGTNRLESTIGPGINFNGNKIVIQGPGSLTVIGGDAAYGIQGKVNIYNNACVVAIGGTGGINLDPDEYTLDNALLISGTKQAEDSITEDYSELKGDNITLGGNLEIPEWATVTIADGQTFTIASNVTLTNKGTIKNEGTLAGTPVVGTLPQHRITFKANDSGSTADDERYILEGEPLPTDIFTRSGYTFQGWYTAADGGTKVETVARAQTLYAQWEADEPAVEPEPPYIPPVPIYYNVYLPQVEGATTDPGPGEYEVELWSTFRFYLTIDSAYSESQPVVTTDRGETLVPRTSNGAYLVKYVRTDVEVFIDGLFKNPPPVANEAISADVLVPQIWAEGSMLCIRMAEALPSAPVRIFTVDGRLYDSFASTPGLNRRQLPTGIYIVRVGETVRKIIVE